jgi:hypothetical protein
MKRGQSKRPRSPKPRKPAQPVRRSPFRVPFVRKCLVAFSDGQSREVFIANINEFGAYLADEEMPQQGQGMTLRFRLPGSETEVVATGAVAWVNPGQQHPVHSLPPGYGLQFDPVKDPLLSFVLGVVAEYLARHSDQH